MNIVLIDNEIKEKELFKSLTKLSITHNKINIGIDFEFNGNIFEIIQLKENNNIWLFKPTIYKELMKSILINNNILKILHGASQDLKYIFNYYLDNNKKYIFAFINTFVDTALLCEFSKEKGVKCSLYSSLKAFKVISDKKYDELIEIEHQIPSYKYFKWNFNKLNDNLVKYIYYDVLYLEKLYLSLKKNLLVLIFIRYTYLCRLNIIEHKFITLPLKQIANKYINIYNDLIKIDYIKKYVTSIFVYLTNNIKFNTDFVPMENFIIYYKRKYDK